MTADTTHPSLLERLRDHEDHAAWRQFDETYRELILRYCRRRGLQRSDAEDVRQMVLFNLAKQLRTFLYQPERGRFRDYLGRTVVNAIARYYRRPRPDCGGLDTHVMGSLEAEADEALDREWEQEWMMHHYRRAMAEVRSSAEKRSVDVFERLLSGETPDQVAAAFGMKRDAVHKIKQRMRDRLKEQVALQIHEEEQLDPSGV